MGEFGAVLIVLVATFVIGRIWFHLVEGALGILKRLFRLKKEPAAWHTLQQDHEKEKERHV